MATAISTGSVVSMIGVNTHIDFQAYGYQNLSITEASINYLGVKTLRDSPENPSDLGANGWWQQVASATGAKFDAYMPEGSVSQMESALPMAETLAAQGILSAIEGGNEEDDSYATSSGNSLATTAQFQQQVAAAAAQYGLPSINMSFGSGWTAANNWQGDYDKVGNLSAYATYANAHTYPNANTAPLSSIKMLNADAALAAPGQPVMITEFGYDANSTTPALAAVYDLDAVFDAQQQGNAGLDFYSLFSDGSGAFGLMNSDGTPTAAGTAIHDLTTLLADPGASSGFVPGSLSYTLTSASGDNSTLMQKSDGTFWISVWNENAGQHTDVLNLGSAAASIQVFDPLTGTTAIQSVQNAGSVTLSLSNSPLLVEVTPAPAGSSTSTSTQSAPPPTSTTTPTLTPNDTVITAPASVTVQAGGTVALSGVSVADQWAAASPGSLAVNLLVNSGTVEIGGKAYSASAPVPGGMFIGTLAQIDTALAGATYTNGTAGTATITVDVWNQAGVETDKTITADITAAPTVAASTTITSTPTTTASVPVYQDLTVTVPGTLSATLGQSEAVPGVVVTDAWGATAGGSMALNVYDQTGTIEIGGQTFAPGGGKVAGGMFTGSLAQINADLSSLKYVPGTAGADALTVDVWNQAGVESTKTIAIDAQQPAAPAAPVLPTVTLSAQPYQSVTASNSDVVGTGAYVLSLQGAGDNLSLSGGNEDVMAFASGNTIDLGAGRNTFSDMTGGNTVEMPSPGSYLDVWGNWQTDTLDLTNALKGTAWTGSQSTVGSFLTVATSGPDAVLSVSATAGGSGTAIATLHGGASTTMAQILAHAVT